MVRSRAEQTSISLRYVGSTSRTGRPGCGWGRDTWSLPVALQPKGLRQRGTVVSPWHCMCPFSASRRPCRSEISGAHPHLALPLHPATTAHSESQAAMWAGPPGPWPTNVFAFLGAQPELAWRNGNLQHRKQGFQAHRKDLTQSFFSYRRTTSTVQ